jgi:hypothetical protein
MKKRAIALIILFIGILFFTGCRKEVLTDEVTCKINGKKYYTREYYGFYHISGVKTNLYENVCIIEVSLKSKNNSNNYYYHFHIEMDANTHIYTTRYITDTLASYDLRFNRDTLIYSYFDIMGSNFFPADSGMAWIEFEVYDPDNRRVKGRFGGTYINGDTGEVLEVTDGKFDIRK